MVPRVIYNALGDYTVEWFNWLEHKWHEKRYINKTKSEIIADLKDVEDVDFVDCIEF